MTTADTINGGNLNTNIQQIEDDDDEQFLISFWDILWTLIAVIICTAIIIVVLAVKVIKIKKKSKTLRNGDGNIHEMVTSKSSIEVQKGTVSRYRDSEDDDMYDVPPGIPMSPTMGSVETNYYAESDDNEKGKESQNESDGDEEMVGMAVGITATTTRKESESQSVSVSIIQTPNEDCSHCKRAR